MVRSVEILRFKILDSTNTFALDCVRGGKFECIGVIADRQSKGRGRLGRFWYDEGDGSICLSVGFRVQEKFGKKDFGKITILYGIKVCRELNKIFKSDIKLKWPNDLYFRGRKLGGILVESFIEGGVFKGLVIGIGLNCRIKNIPEELEGRISDIEEVSLGIYDKGVLEEVMVRIACESFDDICEIDKIFLAKDFSEMDFLFGKSICLKMGNEIVKGICLGIDDSGGILVKRDCGEIVSINSGEAILI